MKKLLLLAILLLPGLLCLAADGLRVVPRTGDPVTFLFEQEPEVSFLAGKLQIKSTVNTEAVTFEFDDIESILFTDASGITAAEASAGMYFTTDAAGVHFYNVPAGATAAVYDMLGATMTGCTAADGEFHLYRGNLKPGIYIVKINQFTTKIAL